MTTSYTAETPWLCWSDWPKVQQYKKANPTWVALCTSLRTDPKYRSIWAPYGHAGLGLIADLILLLAERSVSGIVFGAPEYLQGEMQLTAPPDLSWILAAGWVRYISLAEKTQIEEALAEPKKATKAKPKTARPVGRPRKKNNSGTGTGTGIITETGTDTSGAPARAPSAAIAAPPETGTGRREAQAEPEAQEGPQGPPQRAGSLALVSSLPQPVPAHLGLPGGVVPPESDARGVGRARARNPPPASSPRRGPPRLLGDCLGPLAMAESCPDVWDWVESVYRLLRFPWPINSAEGRRETGSFAAMYTRVMAASLPMGERTKILVSSLKTAEQKGRKPVGYFKKGKGAVFCEVLNRRLKTHLARDG